MAWKKLSARAGNLRTGRPAMSIQKNGRVTWNWGLHEALGRPEWVELLFDREAMLLGIRGSAQPDNCLEVRKASKQETWGVSALAMLRSGAPYLAVSRAFRTVAHDLGDGIWGISVEELAKEWQYEPERG